MLSKAPGKLPIITVADLDKVYSEYKASKVGCLPSRNSEAIQELDWLYNTLDRNTPMNAKQLLQLVGVLYKAHRLKDPKTYAAFEKVKNKLGAIEGALAAYIFPDVYGMEGDLLTLCQNPAIADPLVFAFNSINADCKKHYKCDKGAPIELRNLIYQHPNCAQSIALLFSVQSKKYDNIAVAIEKTKNAMAVVIFHPKTQISPASKSLTFG